MLKSLVCSEIVPVRIRSIIQGVFPFVLFEQFFQVDEGNAGFTDAEREKFSTLLAGGFTDTFRFFYPDLEGAYSWWSYRFRAREKNAGWRIDYFLVSDALRPKLLGAAILNEVMGSDHCPVELRLDL